MGSFSLSSQIVTAFLLLPIVPCLVNPPLLTMRIISVNHKGDYVNLLFETVSKDTNRPSAVIQVWHTCTHTHPRASCPFDFSGWPFHSPQEIVFSNPVNNTDFQSKSWDDFSAEDGEQRSSPGCPDHLCPRPQGMPTSVTKAEATSHMKSNRHLKALVTWQGAAVRWECLPW